MDITVGNVTYPMRASMRAWRKFEKNTGVKVAEVDASDVTLIPELIFYFVEEGCEHNGMRFTMDVDKWLSKIEVTDLPILVEAMTEAMGGKQEEKKKAKKKGVTL
jgi:hypothetical protein